MKRVQPTVVQSQHQTAVRRVSIVKSEYCKMWRVKFNEIVIALRTRLHFALSLMSLSTSTKAVS